MAGCPHTKNPKHCAAPLCAVSDANCRAYLDAQEDLEVPTQDQRAGHPTTPQIVELLTQLRDQLRSTYGVDYSYTVQGYGELLAASNKRHGIITATTGLREEITTPAPPAGKNSLRGKGRGRS